MMPRTRRPVLIELMRRRISRALATGAIAPGDRLPSTREMAAELSADPRVVSAAYKTLGDEGFVEVRTRSGVYVRADAPHARAALVPPAALLVDVLTAAGVRGHTGPALTSALSQVVSARALRTVVIATTADQGFGLARELHDDFGLDASSVLADQLEVPRAERALQRAQLIVTTALHASVVGALATRLKTRHTVVTIRRDLFEAEWSLWRGQQAHVVVLDPRFRRIVRNFFRSSEIDFGSVRVHLATDDLSAIPADAPTYVTHAARAHLGRMKIPGMLVPPTRLFDEACVRALWEIIVELNQQR